MSKQASMPPVSRWSKPGFFDRNIGDPKPDVFMINKRGDYQGPIEINCGDINLKWDDGTWINQNLDQQIQNPNPTNKEIKELQKENAQMQVECEILLHMLTVSEMEKVQCQNKLTELKAKIAKIVDEAENESSSSADI